MVEVLHAGLKDDATPESFTLEYSNRSGWINPCRYVKIVPIAAHGQGYNTTIWHVSLHGVVDPIQVYQANPEFSQETLALRTICSALRRRNLPYRSLLAQTGVYLEHPTVTLLHDAIVHQGNYEEAEAIMEVIHHRDNLIDIHTHWTPPHMKWELSSSHLSEGTEEISAPRPRGGHQLCVDHVHGSLYLFGGWDGHGDLSDFWTYIPSERRWICLSIDVARDGGPEARSCHRIVFEPKSLSLYLLGTRPSPENPDLPPESIPCSDFWLYKLNSTEIGQWKKLSPDTRVEGGPGPIYDHAMAIDTRRGVLYVFGGRVINYAALQHSDLVKYSGLYSFHIESGKWSNLSPEGVELPIPLRSGHSMFYDETRDRLYVVAGHHQQRRNSEVKYLSDIWTYSPQTKTFSNSVSSIAAVGGPGPGLAPRAALDSIEGEIYLFPGIEQTRSPKNLLQSTMWIYQIDKGHCIKVSTQRSKDSGKTPADSELQPLPAGPTLRYAHQVVYDHQSKIFYLFGGTDVGDADQRLNDLWVCSVQRPSTSEILRRAKFHIRRHRFIELIREGKQVEALTYLQTKVHEAVDHEDEDEDETFRSLLKYLLSIPPESPLEDSPLDKSTNLADDSVAHQAASVYNTYRQPSEHTNILSHPVYPGLSEEPRSSSPINLDSPEVNNSALPASSAISSRVGSTQGSDSSFPSPIPDFNQPIARAIGDSFPPPPSPAGDMDPELPYGRPRPSRRWNSHEMDIHRGFRRITSPYRSSPPPPAPIMQYRSLPSAVSRSVSHITDLASTNGETDADPGDKAEPPNIPDSPFRDRRRLFDELMCFIVPEAKEPPKDVTELLGGPPPLELDYAMLK
ncbi:hypothetical protein FRC03_000250 [Tulasnella sp. 419]|nr:hypothetical protein FRC03_000250 [Tulasnella sp. 419]